jgi:hypothetical protein
MPLWEDTAKTPFSPGATNRLPFDFFPKTQSLPESHRRHPPEADRVGEARRDGIAACSDPQCESSLEKITSEFLQHRFGMDR